MGIILAIRYNLQEFYETQSLIANLYVNFRTKAAKDHAFFMAKYMKNPFPFFGLKKDKRQELEKDFFRAYGLPSLPEMPQSVRLLWELPERECQYAAMDIMEKFRKKFSREYLKLFEYCIVNKHWWDTVDLITARFIGTLFRYNPDLISFSVHRWMGQDNI